MGEGVSGPAVCRKALCNDFEHTVADGVTKAVVDDFEAIEIDLQNRYRQIMTPGIGQGLTEPVEKQGAVGQVGAGMMGRQVCQTLFASLLTITGEGQFAHQPMG